MSFWAKFLSQWGGMMLTERLASSKIFQRAAWRTHQTIKGAAENLEATAANLEAQQKAVQESMKGVKEGASGVGGEITQARQGLKDEYDSAVNPIKDYLKDVKGEWKEFKNQLRGSKTDNSV